MVTDLRRKLYSPVLMEIQGRHMVKSNQKVSHRFLRKTSFGILQKVFLKNLDMAVPASIPTALLRP